jgi:flavin-dependent dehydrogenase
VLPPPAESILERLSLEALLAPERRICRGVLRRWNGPQLEREEYPQPGWVIDRLIFDRWLRARARASGVRWVPDRLRMFERIETRWLLCGDHFQDTADFIIDASGRRALVTRRLDARLLSGDKTLAVGVTYGRQTTTSTYLRVERIADGWWYFIDAAQSTTAVFVTSQAFSAAKSGSMLLNALGDSAWAQEARQSFPSWSIPKPVDATPRLRTAAGSGWLAVGDAAASFDPLSSQGLSNALSSAWFASRALLDHLNGEADSLSVYDSAMELTWKRTLRLQDQVYGKR